MYSVVLCLSTIFWRLNVKLCTDYQKNSIYQQLSRTETESERLLAHAYVQLRITHKQCVTNHKSWKWFNEILSNPLSHLLNTQYSYARVRVLCNNDMWFLKIMCKAACKYFVKIIILRAQPKKREMKTQSTEMTSPNQVHSVCKIIYFRCSFPFSVSL